MMINSEKLVEEVKAEISQNNLHDVLPSFESLPMPVVIDDVDEKNTIFECEDLKESIAYTEQHYAVNVIHPIPLGNAIKTFAKKIVRKIYAPVIFVTVGEQNKRNLSISECLKQIQFYILEDLDHAKKYDSEILRLTHETTVLQNEIKVLSERIDSLKNRKENLK